MDPALTIRSVEWTLHLTRTALDRHAERSELRQWANRLAMTRRELAALIDGNTTQQTYEHKTES